MSESPIVLVTGGAGFIGSHLAQRLAEKGRSVRILDDLSTGRHESIEMLQRLYPERIDFLQGDIRDPRTVEETLRGVEEVLHQAALASVERSIRDPWTSHSVNVDGTLRLLDACRRHPVRRFVFAGSSSIYGDQPELPKHEGMAPAPRSPYAMSKRIAEDYARLYAELYGLPTLTLRYFNVFGPRQDPNSPYAAVIPRFLRAILEGQPPTIFGDGRQTRDFTFIENVIDANLAALDCDAPRGQAVNIACGVQTSLLDLLEMICSIAAGRRAEPQFLPARDGDVRDSVADISRARELLGYVPRIPLQEGLKRTFAAFRLD